MHSSTSQVRSSQHSVLLLIGILCTAASLRAPITALGPLLEPVRASFALSASAAGLLTTLPLFAFAVVSPFAAGVAHRFGLERVLFAALVLLIAGIAVRSAGTTPALYAGTCVIGSAIAVANVLLPSLLKRDFPAHVARLTACYALAMITAAGLASAVAVPLDQALGAGWPTSLGSVALLPLAAAILWLPQLRLRTTSAPGLATEAPGASVWKAPLAWQVAAYLGLTCFIHFAAIAWLPSILQEAGDSSARAGALHGWMQLAGAIPALLLMPLLQRMPDQRWISFASPALSALGLVGLLAMPSLAPLWVFAFGMGMGAALILSLAFVGLRAANQKIAASLSGMSQCIGYLLAAVGPTFIGFLHESSGSWTTPLVVCAGLCIAMCALGLSVGRARHIGA
ncbi:CP family cyanate transporter-like MFS transporter [Variovorax paradoxus]|uniref:MFS transporter n=1 Tax=Variovorax atrisoli TaxID=3394203 RepID=UPI00119917CA|nr:MFS transporter [Variovorax paradoxus]MDR6520639.1 CP family cyanate transporter-like MFS transporter [Variovorax paradoxus]